MRRKERYRLDSLLRVQAFLDAYAEALGPLRETEAGRQLDGAVERSTAHALDQGTARRQLAGTGNEAMQRVIEVRSRQLSPLARFARARLRDVPAFDALTHAPHNRQGASIVHAARAMAEAAVPYADVLAAAHFPAGTVEALGDAVGALDRVIGEREAARSRWVVATAGIRHENTRGREAVAMLDPVVTSKLAGQPELLAGWRSAKRVTAMPQSAGVPSETASAA